MHGHRTNVVRDDLQGGLLDLDVVRDGVQGGLLVVLGDVQGGLMDQTLYEEMYTYFMKHK